jgi:hypothetical protein
VSEEAIVALSLLFALAVAVSGLYAYIHFG